jgi:hypothetical protein
MEERDGQQTLTFVCLPHPNVASKNRRKKRQMMKFLKGPESGISV